MADGNDSIASQIPICSKSFRTLSAVLDATAEEKRAHLTTALADQIGRFRVWTQNIGAHHWTGKSSLDYRLRDASHIKIRVIRYLKELNGQLVEAISIVTGNRKPLDDQSFDSDSSDSVEKEDEGFLPTELEQISRDVEQIITCLYRLSMTVRNPTPHDRYIKAGAIDTSFYEPFDIEHVRQKFPTAADFLVHRLGKAISRRRQYLKYRELHRAKLAHSSQPLDLHEVILPAASVVTSTKLTETTASTFIERTPTKEFKFTDVASESGANQTSYATSTGSSSRVRMPSMPTDATNGQPFECPYCYMIDTVKDTRAWRTHVYRDLEPYVCTIEACATANEMYGSRHHWSNHELQKHRTTWTCNGHCDQSFDATDDLVAHLRSIYSNTFPDAQIPALIEMCARPTDVSVASVCPLCNVSTSQLQKHVAYHLEEISLFALPNASANSGEELLFSGPMIDDDYQYRLRILRDRVSGGIRLHASVLQGDMKNMPVWTAFIAQQIASMSWLKDPGGKNVHIQGLQLYIYSNDYRANTSNDGWTVLCFKTSQAAEGFTETLKGLNVDITTQNTTRFDVMIDEDAALLGSEAKDEDEMERGLTGDASHVEDLKDSSKLLDELYDQFYRTLQPRYLNHTSNSSKNIHDDEILETQELLNIMRTRLERIETEGHNDLRVRQEVLYRAILEMSGGLREAIQLAERTASLAKLSFRSDSASFEQDPSKPDDGDQGVDTTAENPETELLDYASFSREQNPHSPDLAPTGLAEKLNVQVMETRKRILGAEHSDTLSSMTNQASIYRSQRRWTEAEELIKQVMEMRKREQGAEHPDTLASMNNLASIYRSQRRWTEAEELFKQVIELRRKALGAEHPDTLTSMNYLASIYMGQGRWTEAEELNLQVMEMRKRVLGPEHPDTLASMNLASIYMSVGRLTEAEELFKQVIELSKRVLGPEHPDTLTSMNNLASIYMGQGRWIEAEELNVQVIEMSKRVLGAEHPETLTSMNNLALIYRSQGRLTEAEEMFEDVIEMRKMVLGAEHSDTLASMNKLALTYHLQGRWTEAEELSKQIIEMSKRVLGAEHPDTVTSMNNLALLYQLQKRWTEAEELSKQIMEMEKITKRVLHRPPSHFDHSAYSISNTTGTVNSPSYIYSSSPGYPPSPSTTHHPPYVSDRGPMAIEVSPRPEGVRVVSATRERPQCWDHGCNGREFSTFSNLLRHQCEEDGTAYQVSYCPHCGVEFTRTTARNGHIEQGKCRTMESVGTGASRNADQHE